LAVKPERKKALENTILDGRIILKWALRKFDLRSCVDKFG